MDSVHLIVMKQSQLTKTLTPDIKKKIKHNSFLNVLNQDF